MPELSRFHGIIIRMYWRDHNPPHFHARLGSQEGVFSLATLGLIEGELPPSALGKVVEWAAIHRAELAAAWTQAQAGQPLPGIAPLA